MVHSKRHPIVSFMFADGRNYIFFFMIVCTSMWYSYQAVQDMPIPLDRVIVRDELREPLHGEVIWFMDEDKTDQGSYSENYTCYNYALDTVKAAENFGIRCYLVVLYEFGKENAHAIVGFNTVDNGWEYYEPQTDNEIFPSSYDSSKWNGLIYNMTIQY